MALRIPSVKGTALRWSPVLDRPAPTAPAIAWPQNFCRLTALQSVDPWGPYAPRADQLAVWEANGSRRRQFTASRLEDATTNGNANASGGLIRSPIWSCMGRMRLFPGGRVGIPGS